MNGECKDLSQVAINTTQIAGKNIIFVNNRKCSEESKRIRIKERDK